MYPLTYLILINRLNFWHPIKSENSFATAAKGKIEREKMAHKTSKRTHARQQNHLYHFKRKNSMRIIWTISIVVAFLGRTWSQEVAFETVQLDTNIYSTSYPLKVCQNIDQAKMYSGFQPSLNLNTAYYNKTTSQYDIFINQIKTASITIPTIPNYEIGPALITQTIFNSDNNWEALCSFEDTSNSASSSYKYILFSATGNIIWQNSTNEHIRGIFSHYGELIFDGTYTYIGVQVVNGATTFNRYYRFHPSLSSLNSALSKTAVSFNTPIPLISFDRSGDFRIKLTHSPAGATTVSLFNLLGQQIFSQTVSDLKKDITFTIPSRSIPGSPVITRVENSQGVSLTKSIPVK